MKAHTFAQLLDLLGPYHDRTAVAASTLALALRSAPAAASLTVAVNKLVVVLDEALPISAPTEAAISDIMPVLSKVKEVVSLVGSKADAMAASVLAEKASSARPDTSLQALLSAFSRKKAASTAKPKTPRPPNVSVIEKYTGELRQHEPGSQGFESVLQSLKDDAAAKAGEMKQIATRLGHDIAEGATRAASLKALSRAHRIIYDTTAKIDAMKGQTAT